MARRKLTEEPVVAPKKTPTRRTSASSVATPRKRITKKALATPVSSERAEKLRRFSAQSTESELRTRSIVAPVSVQTPTEVRTKSAPASVAPASRVRVPKATPKAGTAAEAAPVAMPKMPLPSARFFKYLGSLLVIGAILWAGVHFVSKLWQEDARTAEAASLLSPQEVLTEVRSIMELPTNEDPTIAAVTDLERLKNEPFFQNAQNGDRVIFFPKAKKAILYRPTSRKIIEVSVSPTLSGGGSAAKTEATNSAEDTQTPKEDTTSAIKPEEFTGAITLYNGSTKLGVTNTAEDALLQTFTKASVREKLAAKKDDYIGVTVVDLTGNNQAAANAIAQKMNGKVGTLPAGEDKPDGEILVIIGNATASAATGTTTAKPE